MKKKKVRIIERTTNGNTVYDVQYKWLFWWFYFGEPQVTYESAKSKADFLMSTPKIKKHLFFSS